MSELTQREMFKIPGCVCRARRLVNGKCYAGQAMGTLCAGARDHRGDAMRGNSRCAFRRAVRRHGWKNFVWSVLRPVPRSDYDVEEAWWGALNGWEMYFVEEYKTRTPNGYNMTDGGDGMKGHVWSEESRSKLSASSTGHVGVVHTEATKNWLSKLPGGNGHRRGKSRTDESKEKMSVSRKIRFQANPMPEGVRPKVSGKLEGRKLSDEVRANMRAAWARRKSGE